MLLQYLNSPPAASSRAAWNSGTWKIPKPSNAVAR
jgi:hypothetical protein